jgi:hypothetical protein
MKSRARLGGRCSAVSSGKRRRVILLVRSVKWSWLKAWAMKIARRRGLKKAVVALARWLAVILHRIWVYDRRVLNRASSGSCDLEHRGRDLPNAFGPYTTCYNGFVRWRAPVQR